MEKKEFYKHRLPHFQQPGQAYFVTWCINAAVPKKALERYTKELELLRHQLDAYSDAPPGSAISAYSGESGHLFRWKPDTFSQ
jgi:hypothetical protein